MFTKRLNSTGRRLQIEFLEDRSVPDATVTDVVVPDVPAPDVLAVQSEPVPADDQIVTLNSPLDGNPPVPAVDLAAFTTADKLKPSIGDVVTIRVTVSNNGDVPATGATVAVVLPAGLTFISAQPGQGAFDKDTGIWTAGTVFPGGPVTLAIKGKVIDPAAQDVSASITQADQADPVAENNAASATITPVLAGLKMSQTVSAPTLTVGATVVFTIAVRNTGPGMARNVAIKETLGPGLTMVRAQVPSLGSFNAANNTWKIAALPNGATATVRIIAVVAKTGRLESTSTLTGMGIDDTRSQLSAAGVVTGTKLNAPLVWSYTAPAFKPGVVPVPATAKGAQPALTPTPFVPPSTTILKGLTLPKLGV